MKFQKGRNTVGLVLRTFATKSDLIPERVKQVKAFVEKAVETRLINRIDVLVWADKRYEGCDCGGTAEAMRRALVSNTVVSEVSSSDIFCGLLNYGVALQLRHGIDYSIIASSEAVPYFSAENLENMLAAAGKGALSVGLAITELTESILEGRIANTFAMWHNASLVQVGGFDLVAAKPLRGELAAYLRGWTEKDGGREVFYHRAGVEEIIPLIRLVDTFGPCIAPIRPVGEGVSYIVPDPRVDRTGYERHLQKMGTKRERQTAFAASIGADLSYLKGGVMPDYR